MEKEGLKRALDHLERNNVKMDYIVTDRHTQVQKFLRERGITQYYDVWHLEKGNYDRNLYENNFLGKKNITNGAYV